MKYLLDTHTFLWLAIDDEKLSPIARAICEDSANELFLSLASVWEIQIKVGVGKLQLPVSLLELVAAQETQNRVQLLPIQLAHIVFLADLPNHHRDPFDRMLVAQALSEELTIITNDATLPSYPVRVAW